MYLTMLEVVDPRSDGSLILTDPAGHIYNVDNAKEAQALDDDLVEEEARYYVPR
jgi:hypothetical protein